MKTAAIVIISDNVLKGLVRDTNSHFLAKSLYDIGFRVDNISIISNSSQAIASQVESLAKRHDIVVTSGGLGDLHRAETYQGIATVFHICGKLEESGKVLHETSKHAAVVQIENVYIFPGYPPFLQSSFKALTKTFLDLSDCVFYTRVLHTSSADDSIKRVLHEAKMLFADKNLTINRIKLDDKLVRISFESTLLDSVIECETFFKQQLKKLSMDNILLFNFNANEFLPYNSQVLNDAISVLEKCFTDYKISEVFLSFNGGKDCTVLLYLTMTVLNRMFPRSINHTLQCVYIQCDNAFEEEENFIHEILEYCNLPLITVKGGIRDALETILASNPNYKAVLMGTRRTDPYSEHLQHFQMTDANWPQVMRVNPILDWNYAEIWDFLRNLHVPYCHLYDEGYTSIGSKHNTKRNPALLTGHGYLPAYLLTNGAQEREGRETKSS